MTSKGDFPDFDLDPAVESVLGQSQGKRGWGKKKADDPAPAPIMGVSTEQLAEALLLAAERQRRAGRGRDRHKGTSTLGARVSDRKAAEVRAAAEAEGLTVSTWLTAAIECHLRR